MTSPLLSYDDALAKILAVASSGARRTERCDLLAAGGYALAESIVATENLPRFANSAVDGYAVRLNETRSATRESPVRLPVQCAIPAGSPVIDPLAVGACARIFTGAPVPDGADAIVMQEDSAPAGDEVLLFTPGETHFVRAVGSDIVEGARVAEPGMTVDAGLIGLMAALGQTEVPVLARPRVALLTTGDEVVSPATRTLAPGQIRDANSPALQAALREIADVVHIAHIPDSKESTRTALVTAAKLADIVVTSGGVSVGEHDHITPVLAEVGTLDFWRIAVRPGKPLAFGQIGGAHFFGLPGNPVSSLVTFELFVRPFLRALGGHTEVMRPRVWATLTTSLSHEPGRRQFARGRLEYIPDGLLATPIGAQGSHRLASMLGADALLIADEAHGTYAAGEPIPALLLRNG